MRASILSAFVALLLISPTSQAGNLPNATFWVGYNEAWVRDDYGVWLSANPSFGLPSKFPTDRVFLNGYLSGMAAGKARIVSIWLFPALQGILRGGDGTLTTGLSPDFLPNLTEVLSSARRLGLKVYVTALNGNDLKLFKGTLFEPYAANLLSNATARQYFKLNALLPLLKVLNSNKDVIYGFDLINEIEAVLAASYVDAAGARAWIREMASYVTVNSPWAAVTASSGYYPVTAILGGLYTGLGLNFYDAHIYSDVPAFSLGQRSMCQKAAADGVQLVLGEFGQSSKTVNDWLQYYVTSQFLTLARASCIHAALAWKYESTTTPWFAYVWPNGAFRPAYNYIKTNF